MIILFIGLTLMLVGIIAFGVFFYLYFKQKMETRELQKKEYFNFLNDFDKNLQKNL